MVLSLLFGKKYAQSQVGTVTLDATITENHQYNSRVTSYPVEDGRLISDHIINEPEIVQITGIVTDSPLSLLSSFNRSIDAFNRLVRIHDNREIVSVITGIKIYTNMVITSLNIPRDVTTGQSLTFNIELQKILIDNSVRLNLDPNNPFNKLPDKIAREDVANANQYPGFGQDPNTSFKDQASSKFDAGIQNLLPVNTNIRQRVLDQGRRINAGVLIDADNTL